jgi:hypothetical protein
VADFKLSEAATAVAFAPPDASDEFVVPCISKVGCAHFSQRRMLAVGLENGNILLFTSSNVVKWEMSLEIKPGYAALT